MNGIFIGRWGINDLLCEKFSTLLGEKTGLLPQKGSFFQLFPSFHFLCTKKIVPLFQNYYSLLAPGKHLIVDKCGKWTAEKKLTIL
jgi:hypothetical protein